MFSPMTAFPPAAELTSRNENPASECHADHCYRSLLELNLELNPPIGGIPRFGLQVRDVVPQFTSPPLDPLFYFFYSLAH